MRANRTTLVKLCLLTALAVPVQRAASATIFEDKVDGRAHQQNATQLLLSQASEAAQFTLPASLEDGTTLLIDGSSSMRTMNEALIERFSERYSDARVESEETGSDVALERLLNGEINIAAIGRPLTEEEQAAGLSAVPIAREKIAIIVDPQNAFEGDISFTEFGGIFRGEITDWSELNGGESGPIRFVDRPESSDTRQAFRPYPVFQEAPFETGATVDPVSVDDTDTVVEALGEDGIGYAIANQVIQSDDVKIIPMHGTLPDDPRYPFSQPRNYVYLGEPSPAVQGFLGIATSPEGQETVEEVRETESAAAVTIEGPVPTATSPDGELTARTDENNMAIIEDESGELVAGPLAGAGGAVTALAFSEDGETLATGTKSGNVRFWSVDGESKGKVFQAITGQDNAVTELKFTGNDKLLVSGSAGRVGLWGLNGLPYDEDGAAVGAVGARDVEGGFPWWLLLIPLLGLLGGGLFWLLGRGRKRGAVEPIRQTSPTATVPPPTTDPANEREVSSRAQTVIKTDRVTDESRPLIQADAVSEPISANESSTPSSFESTDLESPDLEGTNLDLINPVTLGGAAAVGGIAIGAAGLDAGLETDEDEDVWDDNIDLTIDEPPLDSTVEPSVNTLPADSLDAVAPPAEASPPTPIGGIPPVGFMAGAAAGAAGAAAINLDKSDLNNLEPTRDTVIAEPESVPNLEPTRETIISDNAVIFGAAAGSSAPVEAANSNAADISAGSDVSGIAPTNGPTDATSPDNAAASGDPVAPPQTGTLAANLSGGAVAAVAATVAATGGSGNEPSGSGNKPSGSGNAPNGSGNEPNDSGNVLGGVPPEQPTFTTAELSTVDTGLSELPEGYGESTLVLLPRDPQWAYAYWDVSNEHKEELRQQGGQRLMLRLYDVTDIDLSNQSPHRMQQMDCDELARSWYVEVPVSDRDYVAEIGYLTADDRWLMLTRSAQVRVPPIYPSDWVNDQFVTISFDESLTGRTFGSLGRPPVQGGDAVENLPRIYDDLFAMTQGQEAMRVAGSLFGSMHQVAPGALSPSGNVSGLNMSGLNVSGLNMSGVGMSRARKFWLIADAELIVYGATEPDATLTVGDRTVPLNPDGTFRFHVSFPDGQIDYPIKAVASDGEQSRSIHLHFERETPERNTNTKDEAKDEWF